MVYFTNTITLPTRLRRTLPASQSTYLVCYGSSMMAKQMEYGEIIAFFEERYRILDSSELSYQRKTFSFENPHRCRHCQDSFITVATQYPRTHCMYCSFAGIDQSANDGRDPICGQCHWPYENVEQRTFSATLGYDLAKAIAAAKEGCVLYERLVDDVVLKMRGRQDWRTSDFLRTTDYRFQLRANSYSSGGIHSCTLKATFTLETNLAALVIRRGLSLEDLRAGRQRPTCRKVPIFSPVRIRRQIT